MTTALNLYLSDLDQFATIDIPATFEGAESESLVTLQDDLYMTIPLDSFKAWTRFKSNSEVLSDHNIGVQLISNIAGNWCQNGSVLIGIDTVYNILTEVPDNTNTKVLVDVNSTYTIGNSVGAFMAELSNAIFGSKVMLDAMTNELDIITEYKNNLIAACDAISINFNTRKIIENSENYTIATSVAQDVTYMIWNQIRFGDLLKRFSMAYGISNTITSDASTTHTYIVTGGSGVGAVVTLTVDITGAVVTIAYVSTVGSGYIDGDVLTYTDSSDPRILNGVFTCTINTVQAGMLNGDLMNDITSNVVNTVAATSMSMTYTVSGGSGSGGEINLNIDSTKTIVNTGSVTIAGSNYVVGDQLIYTESNGGTGRFICTINAVQAKMLNGDNVTGEGIGFPYELDDVFHTKITALFDPSTNQKNIMGTDIANFNRTIDLELKLTNS